MLNRAAIILKYKEPMIRWINEADRLSESTEISAEYLARERTIYLISDRDGESDASVDRWIRRNYEVLFETELNGWYTLPSMWPNQRTLRLFRAWFEVEYHTVLIDTVGSDIHDDGV
jgi:hypothetical protein